MRDGQNFEIYSSLFSSLLLTVLKTHQGTEAIGSNRPATLLKETPAQVLSCEFEVFKNTFFIEDLRWLLLKRILRRNIEHFLKKRKYEKAFFEMN